MNEPFTAEMAKTMQRQELSRIIKLLKELHVLRDSMFGDDWYVIYTEYGAKDLSKDTLEGKL